jgi:hypothetical protein
MRNMTDTEPLVQYNILCKQMEHEVYIPCLHQTPAAWTCEQKHFCSLLLENLGRRLLSILTSSNGCSMAWSGDRIYSLRM